MHLEKDFTQIYHLDLHGNVRKNPYLSGTTHNVFGIQVGVGITIAVRNSRSPKRAIYYYRTPEFWRKTDKFAFLAEKKSLADIDWVELQPDDKHTWLTEGIHDEFAAYLAMGKKDAKSGQDANAIFSTYSGGMKTNRDTWAYDFDKANLAEKMQKLIETYNGEVDRWKRRSNQNMAVDDFVTNDEKRIKWSGDLKTQLTRGRYASFAEANIRYSLYRPFVKQYLYFDGLLNNSVYLQHFFFPTVESEGKSEDWM